MDVGVIFRSGGSNSLPSGHANFDSGHPGLLEHLVEGVAVIEVLVASLGTKVVQDEGSQDVK